MATNALADQLARLAQPWATYYADHGWLQTTVLFAHLSAIFLGGGFAMATDRDTFIAVRAARLSGQIRHLGRLRTIHKPVALGLVLALVSGVLLFAADVEHFSGSPVFWVKMLLLVALLTNGYLLKRTEETLSTGKQDSPHLWGRLWKISAASMALWLLLILAGTLLASG
ncbi:MAG TPA: hypothetical protein VHJ69_05520 [Gemmatimonadales bacterium]|jgi:hypothetical protein|nr:hypothetical protein [Gemmatimonadales bacterium]